MADLTDLIIYYRYTQKNKVEDENSGVWIVWNFAS